MLGCFLSTSISYLTLFIPMACFTFGRGLSQPSAQSTAVLSTSGATATATGLQGFFQLFVGSVMAQATPLLMAINIIMLPIILVIVVLLAWLFMKFGDKASRGK